ncbi:MAG TPA: hypothetical protein VKB65_00040 [Myxococcota bacterium]|nr:hypothetical protein [Myxococcota bacterium]
MTRRASRGRATRARRALGAGALALAALAAIGAGGDPSQPGAYCPLPKAGEVPRCLADAQETYGGFFLGVHEGELDDAAAQEVESAVRAGQVDALSSLSYGYFMLARAQAASETPDPERIARLEHWNQLLADAYNDANADPRYRASVREAAVDINANVPALGLRCLDEDGKETRCASTEAVVRAIDLRRQQTGLRGALARLLGSLFGSAEEPQP